MKFDLLDHDHSELDALLAEFFRALQASEVRRCHDVLDLFWARLAVHIRAEHLHLFPALLHAFDGTGRPGGATDGPALDEVKDAVARLRHEHDVFMTEIWAALKQLRDLPGRPAEEIAATLRSAQARIESVNQRLQAHNRREEGQVYRWADAWLSPEARSALNDRMQAELEHLPPRFAKPASGGMGS